MALQAKRNNVILFNQGLIQFLLLDKNKNIILNDGPAVPAGFPTVGYKRFFEAKTAGSSADLVATIPVITTVDPQDLVEVERFDRSGKKLFRIVQVQERPDAAPPCLQLTLAEERVKYVDKR